MPLGEIPDDDPPRGHDGGGGVYTGPIGGGTGTLASLFGGGGNAGWQPFYSGLGSGSPMRRRWKYLPGQQGLSAGQAAAAPAAGMGSHGMFGSGQSDPLRSILDGGRTQSPMNLIGGNRPQLPPGVHLPPSQRPGGGGAAPGYAPGSMENGYIATGGAFDYGKFLGDIGSGKYFDSQNDVLSQLLDQRAAQDERNALMGANSEFKDDPSLAGFARLQARQNSGRNRTQGLLSAKKSQQDFVNELYRTLGLGQAGHRLNVDFLNKSKPDDASDFEKFMASLGGLPIPFRGGGGGGGGGGNSGYTGYGSGGGPDGYIA